MSVYMFVEDSEGILILAFGRNGPPCAEPRLRFYVQPEPGERDAPEHHAVPHLRCYAQPEPGARGAPGQHAELYRRRYVQPEPDERDASERRTEPAPPGVRLDAFRGSCNTVYVDLIVGSMPIALGVAVT